MYPNLANRALITALLTTLLSACGAGAALDKAKQIDTVVAYDEFIRDYADSEYVEEARDLRELSLFHEAKAQDSVRAYQKYLREYDRSRLGQNFRLREQANAAIDRLRYEEAMDIGTIQAYNRYLRLHPNGSFTTQVNINREKLLFAQAEQESTLRAYDSYLSEYPYGKSAPKAHKFREELFFAQANQASTPVAYASYLSQYPNGQFAAKARSAHEKLLFEQAEQYSTVSAYDYYINEYPNGKFIKQARSAQDKLAFAQAERVSTPAAYDYYLSEYPNGKFIKQARSAQDKLAFAQAREVSTLVAYDYYLSEYPNGKFISQAHNAKDELAFAQAERASTPAAYDSYLSEYPNGKFIKQAGNARDELLFEEAELVSTQAAYEKYLEQYPQGIHFATAYERLNSLRRSITWSFDSNFSVDFEAALTAQEFGSQELKDLPLYYYVYLYTQAAKGRSLHLDAPIKPLAPKAHPYPDLPAEPILERGEFETSRDFIERKNEALQKWLQNRQAQISEYELGIPDRKLAYELRLAEWQKLMQLYKNELAELRLQAQDPNQLIDWQQQAVRIALSDGFNLDSLQYDADQELFNYTISSKGLSGYWQGQLAVPLAKAQNFKSNLQDTFSVKLHFYLNPNGRLELLSVTDQAANISVNTQNVTSEPYWLPSSDRLTQLELHNLSLSSNVHSDQILINGNNYGPTPLLIKLTSGNHSITISKAGYNTYSKQINIRSAQTLQVELRSLANDLRQDCPQCPRMVYIPTGRFTMGDIQGGGDAHEKPVHSVNVEEFLLSQTEVTFAEWDACVADGGCKHKPDDEGWGRGSRPVINVSWVDITEQFLPWLERLSGRQYRLPTEAEWEYAARAGSETRYSWGNAASHEYANYGKDVCCGVWVEGKDKWEYTSPVTSSAANAFDLYEMHGNVWEWTQSCWSNDYDNAISNGLDHTSDNCRWPVLRSGSWNSDPYNIRSASRISDYIYYRSINYGLRLAITLD